MWHFLRLRAWWFHVNGVIESRQIIKKNWGKALQFAPRSLNLWCSVLRYISNDLHTIG
jgi:hypothetical protein